MRVLGGGVAEDERTPRPDGERIARREAREVDGVQQHADLGFGNAVLADEPVAARVVDGDVATDAREARRRLLPRRPSMTDVHRRYAREAQERGHGLEVVMAVDQVERHADRIEPVDDGDRLPAQLLGHGAEIGAERDGRVAAREQRGRHVAYPELRPRVRRECVVGDQDAEAAHGSSSTADRQTAAASGAKCSR